MRTACHLEDIALPAAIQHGDAPEGEDQADLADLLDASAALRTHAQNKGLPERERYIYIYTGV